MTPVYLEVGKKRVFACAVDWPGWARGGRDEAAALAALEAYAARYALAVPGFKPARLDVVERTPGNATTDFGAPGVVPDLDRGAVSAAVAARDGERLAAVWTYFDRVVAQAPAELRKGPRGGGRDRDKIVAHVTDAELMYASAVGLKGKSGTREAILGVVGAAKSAAEIADLKWPTRYMVRRAAWHVMDHGWEIEDRTRR